MTSGKLIGESLGLSVRLKESFSSWLTMLNGTETGLESLGELMAGISGHPLNPLFHPTIGSNRETNRSLGHPLKML